MHSLPDPEYAEARRVLLDALGALGHHRKAVVLVGAQAIYLRVGAGELLVAPFTTDDDLASMAVRAHLGVKDAAIIAGSCVALAAELRRAWEAARLALPA